MAAKCEKSFLSALADSVDMIPKTMHIIHLNIGGDRFSTTVDTIMKCPESELARLVGEEMARCCIKNQQEIFIDRDGKVFRYILEYLRHENLLKFSEEKGLRRELLIEAEYYKLSELTEAIYSLLHFKKAKFTTGDCVKFNLPENSMEKFLDWIKSQMGTACPHNVTKEQTRIRNSMFNIVEPNRWIGEVMIVIYDKVASFECVTAKFHLPITMLYREAYDSNYFWILHMPASALKHTYC